MTGGMRLRWRVMAYLVFILWASGGLAGCGNQPDLTLTPTETVAPSPQSTLTATALPPSLTPVPLAALVNGEAIALSAYQAELARAEAALGTQLATEDSQRVLDDLINQVLLAQAAAESGFVVDEALLQQRYNQLAAALGSQQALSEWMADYNYTEDIFRQDLARSIAAAWMRDQIIADVPDVAEQVHARQILLYNSADADQALARLRSGSDFADLAATYDPLTKGELGWFPRGYLLDSELERIAFELQPGEYSSVVETPAGFHILQVIEREPQRELSPSALLALQEQALRDWLAARRSQSEIQILTP